VKSPLFRIGTTSYIIPDDLVPNVRYLAGKVRDVELVLFEIDGGPGNLPDERTLAALKELADEHDLSYTVHLPLDLRLAADGDAGHPSMEKARRVIEATRDLSPWAFVLHLDGREVRQGATAAALKQWTSQAVQALEVVAGWAGGPERMAVENLEGYPVDFLEPVLGRFPARRCVDIGHLWLDGHDPLPYLERALLRTRVVHIHGIGARDHSSLRLVPPAELRRVLRFLVERAYQGVLTIEVFGEEDFSSSARALSSALENI
jgi:sugar phosphate isomerase/epimerase